MLMRRMRRRVLFDICHPAEVHHFTPVYRQLVARGWQGLFAAKSKDVTEALLRSYDVPYTVFATSQRSLGRKVWQAPLELLRFFRLVRRFRPSLLVSTLSLHSSWIAAMLGVPHIVFADTEHRRLLDALTVPLVTWMVTPNAYHRSWGKRHIRYAGNHELAYLHPKRFRPNPSIRQTLGLTASESYVVLRIVAWQAFHDVGQHGLAPDQLNALVRALESTHRVFITSEGGIPDALQAYRLPTPPEALHHVLYDADAYIGEGATTASEAVCLGTPAILVNSLRVGYCDEESRAGLLRQYESLTPEELPEVLRFIEGKQSLARHQEFIRSHIDVAAFMTWLISDYPASVKTIRDNPQWQERFETRAETGTGSPKTGTDKSQFHF